jgi:hypothetical protein
MATRSNIAVQLPNGKYLVIYAHWDGYYSHNGNILLNHYKTTRKAMKLVNNGDLSSLRKMVSTKHEHSFDTPRKNVTIFYGRDRGEKDTNARTVSVPYLENEFLYVWKKDKTDGKMKWFARDTHGINNKLVVLTKEMCID